jgi:hypothetical protein
VLGMVCGAAADTNLQGEIGAVSVFNEDKDVAHFFTLFCSRCSSTTTGDS